jgi:hypothetical protein
MVKQSNDNEIQHCRKFLKDVLNHKDIPMYAEESILYIDYMIAQYIKESNHDEWLSDDYSMSPEIGEVPMKVLSEFARQETIFEGIQGKYKIMEFEKNKTKYFQAWPVSKPSKTSVIKEIYSKEKMN